MPTLSIEIPDDLDQSVRRAAAIEGLTVEAWAAKKLRGLAPTPEDHARSVGSILEIVARIDAERAMESASDPGTSPGYAEVPEIAS